MDVTRYQPQYSEPRFWDKLKRVAIKAGLKVIYLALVLYYTLMADTTSTRDRMLIIGTLGYLISSLDLVPDWIPVVGYADDLSALIACYRKVHQNVTPAILSQADQKVKQWFPTAEQLDLTTLL